MSRNDDELDAQIDQLIRQAESLVIDLGDTVSKMKVILIAASTDIQGAKDERDKRKK
jgi:hypothetical protein